MKKPNIISMIKVNGEWINQDDLPPEFVQETVKKVLERAGNNIGLKLIEQKKSA